MKIYTVHSQLPILYYLRPRDRTGISLKIKRLLGSKGVAEEHQIMY